MIQFLILIFFFFCTISCFFIFKDIISPPVILSVVWLIAFGFYLYAPFNTVDENQYYLIFPIGHLLFILGYVLFYKTYNKKGVHSKRKSYKYIINTRVFKFTLFIQFLVLVSVLPKILNVISSNFVGNWWFSLKYAASTGTYENGVIFDYTRILSFVISYVLSAFFFLNKESKLKKLLVVQLTLSSLFAVLSLGRTFLFQLFIPVFFMYLISNPKNNYQAFKFLIRFAIVALVFFFSINALKYFNSTSSVMDSFYLYLSGSIKGLVVSIENINGYMYGQNTFRFIFSILGALGYDVKTRELAESFIPIGNGFSTNVFTIYNWYYNDFGLLYALFMQFIIGILHGKLYSNAHNKGTISSITLLSMSYYPLIMQFFQDQYISLSSSWIQMFFWLIIILQSGWFIKKEGEGKLNGNTRYSNS